MNKFYGVGGMVGLWGVSRGCEEGEKEEKKE